MSISKYYDALSMGGRHECPKLLYFQTTTKYYSGNTL